MAALSRFQKLMLAGPGLGWSFSGRACRRHNITCQINFFSPAGRAFNRLFTVTRKSRDGSRPVASKFVCIFKDDAARLKAPEGAGRDTGPRHDIARIVER